MNINELLELAERLEDMVRVADVFELSRTGLARMVVDAAKELREQADKTVTDMIAEDPYTTDADRRYFEGI